MQQKLTHIVRMFSILNNIKRDPNYLKHLENVRFHQTETSDSSGLRCSLT